MKKEIIEYQNKINYKETSNYINCYSLNSIKSLEIFDDKKINKLEKLFFKNLKLKYMKNKELFTDLINLKKFPFDIYVPNDLSIYKVLKNPLLFRIIIENKYKCLLRYFAYVLSYQYDSYITTLNYGNMYESLNKLNYENYNKVVQMFNNITNTSNTFEEKLQGFEDF